LSRPTADLILDIIPAWLCVQCGETSFEEAAVKAIQQVIRAVDTHTEKLLLAAS
jgi:hypothetical protein